jgi:predicted DNA-binding transcriptional regulator AlpA
VCASMADGPPTYVSKSRLAHELDCAESTVDEMVRRGVLPKPYHLSNGCVRWCWLEIDASIKSLRSEADVTDIDPYILGARDAAKEKQ